MPDIGRTKIYAFFLNAKYIDTESKSKPNCLR